MNSTEVWWRSSLFKDIANDSSGFHETFKMMLLEWKQLVDNEKFKSAAFCFVDIEIGIQRGLKTFNRTPRIIQNGAS